MSVIYSIENSEEGTPALCDAMVAERRAYGTGVY